MVPLLFALSMFLSPVKHNGADAVVHAVQDFAPATVQIVATRPSLPGRGAELTAEESELFNLINQDRQAQGLSPVQIDSELTEIAREHSKDMCDRKYFDHYAPSPGPVTPMDRYLAHLGHRPDYAMVGENIYYRSMTDVPEQTQNQAETAFMNSPGHRANILQGKFNKVGVGFYRSPSGAWWVTQMFLRDCP